MCDKKFYSLGQYILKIYIFSPFEYLFIKLLQPYLLALTFYNRFTIIYQFLWKHV